MTPVEQFILEKLRARFLNAGDECQPCIQNDEELAAQFGVHVQTIRSVLARLEREGRLHLPANESLKPSVRESVEFFEVREAIEGMAARLVVRRGLEAGDANQLRHLAEKIDRYVMDAQQPVYEKQFHQRVVELSGNRLLVRMYAMIEPFLPAGMPADGPHHFKRDPTEEMKQRHVRLVDVLQEGSEEDAERAFREHCTKVISFIIAENRGIR